jgi:hypothetical protein
MQRDVNSLNSNQLHQKSPSARESVSRSTRNERSSQGIAALNRDFQLPFSSSRQTG